MGNCEMGKWAVMKWGIGRQSSARIRVGNMGKHKIGILEGDKEKIGFCLGNFWLIERVGLSKA